MSTSHTTRAPVPKQQPDAILNQPNPIQNTWYTILDTTNCRLIYVAVRVLTTGETLEVRLTVDGQAYTYLWIATAATYYYVSLIADPTIGGVLLTRTPPAIFDRSFIVEGRAVKFELRKTSANGAGNFEGCCIWAKW